MSKEEQKNAVPIVLSGDYGLDGILGKGTPVSIQDDKFGLVVSRSIDPEIVDPIIAEIKAKREKLKVKHIIACVVCFAMLGVVAYGLFPRARITPVADAWDVLNVNPEPYETEKSLSDSLIAAVNAPCLQDSKSGMSREQRMNAFKYRTMNIMKIPSVYMAGFDQYITNIYRLANRYEDMELKECYIEGVLKSFPWDETSIGLVRYANEIKQQGDAQYQKRYIQLPQAIIWCDDILKSLYDDEGAGAGKKKLSVKLQKAQLYMYVWLVENVKNKKGARVEYFPDDKGDTGVYAREEAVRIIREGVWTVPEGKELHDQCIDVLITDSSKCNFIYFGGKKWWSHKRLWDQRYK